MDAVVLHFLNTTVTIGVASGVGTQMQLIGTEQIAIDTDLNVEIPHSYGAGVDADIHIAMTQTGSFQNDILDILDISKRQLCLQE